MLLTSTPYKTPLKKLNKDERRIVCHHASGGAWDNDKLANIGRAQDAMCLHCGNDTSGGTHFWTCSELEGARHVEGSKHNFVTKDMLPPSLQQGLPPAMHANYGAAFWSNVKHPDFDSLPPEQQQLLGNILLKDQKRVQAVAALVFDNWIKPENDNITLDAQPDHEGAQQFFTHTCSARQLFNRCSGETHHPIPHIHMNPIEGTPPDDVNTFSDGSVTNPAQPQWSIAAYGLLHTRRKIDDHPISKEEDVLVNMQQVSDGLEGWGAVQGPNASSTRSELAGGIAALLAPYPIHLGSDSRSFVNKANLILKGAIRMTDKPWQLHHDGDLWQLFANIVEQRGASSVRISWVKGHAKQRHLDEGITTEWRKKGNDRADAIAGRKGHTAHPKGLLILGDLLADRQRAYEELITHVHKVIAQTFAEEQKLRNEDEKRDVPAHLRPKRALPKAVAKRLYYHPPPRRLNTPRHGFPPTSVPSQHAQPCTFS